ncbi:MAG: histidine kinase N-terminal 7TM domain-containing protein [Chloroflexota bacterium]
MQFEYSPYILPLIAAALVSTVVAVYAWMNRSVRGAKALSFMALALAIWAGGYALEIAGANLSTKYIGGVIQYIGIPFAPYTWLIFSLIYSDTTKTIPRRFFLFTFLVPVITSLLALTTKWHGLIWSEYHIQRDGNFSALAVSYGPWFYVHFVFSYLCLLIGTILLARVLWRNRQELYRGQIILLMVSVLAPWVGNALYLTGNSPIPYLDLTPFAFTVTVTALASAIFGLRLVDISPALPRETSPWYRARLTMAVSGLTLLFYFIPELIAHLFVPLDSVSLIEALIILLGTTLTLAGFLTAKSGRIRPAIWLTLVGWTLDILLDIAFGEGMELSATMEIWLMFGLVMAFLLLDLRQYIVFAIVQTLSAWLVEWIRYRIGLDISVSVEIHLAAAVLLGVGTWLRERDQRQRDEASAALQKQKDYLQSVVDGIQSPFYVVDVKDYRIRLANRAARELGLMEERVTCYALTHHRSEPCGGDEHPCPLQRVRIERQPYATEHIHFRPDGSTYYAEVRGYPLFDENGEVTQMVEYSVDITERKRAEAEIRKLQQAVEHAASGVAITDPQGIFEYVNPTFERMTGYTRKEVIGQTPRLLKSGRQPKEFYEKMWQTIQSGKVWQGEIVNRRKDGSLYWEFQTIAPVSSNGKITHHVAVKLDITAQKELEEQLREAKETAESASAFKSQLLSRVSHELRTPLGGVLGYAELMQSDAFGALSDQQREAIRNIIDSAHYLNQMVNDLLNEAEIAARSIKLQNDWFSPAELLEKTSANLSVQADKKGLAFTAEISSHLPEKLFGDSRRIQQIIINLAGNAIKFTTRGEVRVRLERPTPDQWAIVVSDTGAGIPKEAQGYIFEPFRQVDNRITRENRGSGLGLSITKHLVELMGGQIALESEVGKGSVFTVTLPILDASGKPAMRKPRAIVIEDDPILSQVYATALQASGFDVVLDINGNQYASLIAETLPALVLLDLHLPYASGEDILTDLRTKYPDVVIAVVTADIIKVKSLPAKADHVLIKPVSVERLQKIAEEAKGVRA